MSTTRKIEVRKLNGWVDDRTAHGPVTSMEWTKMFFRPIPTASLRATLIIGGKGYTEEEVKAMVKEMIEAVSAGEEFTQESIAAKHGITL